MPDGGEGDLTHVMTRTNSTSGVDVAPRARKRVFAAAVVVIASLHAATGTEARQAGVLPFSVGERLTFSGYTDRLGAIGRGEMVVDGPVNVRGISAWVLRFSFKAGIGPLGASEKTSSWIDASRMTSLRFEKRTRKFLSGSEQRVEMYPETRRWTARDGTSGTSLSAQPLDELSFIYFLRTLPFDQDSTFILDRHFNAARNPTKVTILGRQTIETKAGRFNTVVIEMVVKDARNYEKEGQITFLISDDARRLPVKIESRMPGVGLATLTLESHNVGELVAGSAPKNEASRVNPDIPDRKKETRNPGHPDY
jgi:hypothetical protein